MSPDQLAYYRARAMSERAIAAEAVGPAAEIHLKLALLYEELLELEESGRPALTIVPDRLTA